MIDLTNSVERIPIAGCWIWLHGMHRGYGFARLNGKTMTAHRAVWISLNGEPPKGWHVDHLCRNTACVNPAHLEAVTPQVNTLRGNSIQAQNARKTHCKRGHEFNSSQTYYTPEGARYCKLCRREVQSAWRERNRNG